MKMFSTIIALMMLAAPVAAQPLSDIPTAGSSSSLFSARMANMGLRWTQDVDQFGDFWESANNNNGMRLYGTAFLGTTREHQVQIAWDQAGMTGPWDTFRSRDDIGDTIFVEYQYNFE